MDGCKLPKQFSDKWLKEFKKALECPTFKVTKGKSEDYLIDGIVVTSDSGKRRSLTRKERNNLLIARSLIPE